MRKRRVKKINNIHLQNFLEERGIRPEYEDYYTECAYYRDNKELSLLLERFNIMHCAINNGK